MGIILQMAMNLVASTWLYIWQKVSFRSMKIICKLKIYPVQCLFALFNLFRLFFHLRKASATKYENGMRIRKFIQSTKLPLGVRGVCLNSNCWSLFHGTVPSIRVRSQIANRHFEPCQKNLNRIKLYQKLWINSSGDSRHITQHGVSH